MNAAKSPEDAAELFAKEFERPKDVAQDRGEAARQFHETGTVDTSALTRATGAGSAESPALKNMRTALAAFNKVVSGSLAPKEEPQGFAQFQAIGLSEAQTKDLEKKWATMPRADQIGFLELLDKTQRPARVVEEAFNGPRKSTEEYVNKSLATVKGLASGATLGAAPVVEGIVRSGGKFSGPEYEAGVARARAPMEKYLSPQERMATSLVGSLATGGLPMKALVAAPAAAALMESAGKGEDWASRGWDAAKAEAAGLGLIAGGYGAAAAGKYVGNLASGPTKRALKRFGEALKLDAATPEGIAAKRAELGPEAITMDTGGSAVQALAKDTYSLAGKARDDMEAVLTARDRNLGAQLEARIADATGIGREEYAANMSSFLTAQRDVGRDEIDRVIKATQIVDPKISDEIYKKAPSLLKEAKSLKETRPALQDLSLNNSRLIDEAWNKIAFKPVDEGGWTAQDRAVIAPLIDEAIPGWRAAHAKYAPAKAAEEAMLAGEKAVTQDRMITRAELAKYDDNQFLTALYRQGAVNALLRKAANNPDKTIRDVLGAGDLNRRLEVVMNNPEAFASVFDEVVNQATMAASNRIARSKTTGNLPGGPGGRPPFDPEAVGFAASGNSVGMIRAAARVFKGMLNTIQGKRPIDPKEAQVLAKVLTARGAEIDKYAQDALKLTGPISQTAPRGGALLGATAASTGAFDDTPQQ